MVFVFSLEDEISFQTVYNYFLRLCSFRNASEVPMVLVGTQGERASRGDAGALGPQVAGTRKPGSPALLALDQPFRVALERAPPLCPVCAGPSPVKILPSVWWSCPHFEMNKQSGQLVSTQ